MTAASDAAEQAPNSQMHLQQPLTAKEKSMPAHNFSKMRDRARHEGCRGRQETSSMQELFAAKKPSHYHHLPALNHRSGC